MRASPSKSCLVVHTGAATEFGTIAHTAVTAGGVLAALVAITVFYVLATEILKGWFYRQSTGPRVGPGVPV